MNLSAQPHKINPYIILDFETGGLDCKKHAVTEIGCIALSGDTLSEIGRYESYIRPYLYEYDQRALDATNITFEKLNSQGKDLKIATTELADFFTSVLKKTSNTHTKKPILVGHNIKFDIGFLQQIFKESKLDLSKYLEGSKDFYGNFYPSYIDSIHIAKLAHGYNKDMSSYKLSSCMEENQLELPDAHKAINDVIAVQDLLSLYTGKLRSDLSTSVKVNTSKLREEFKFEF